MVARFDPYKDHGTLLAAVAAVARQAPKVVCLLAGPGMLASNEEVAALVARQGAGGCVRLLGPRTDVPKIMAALDLHVLSSAAESFPNVLAEAMACATPCVSTDVGDAAAMVGETGWLVPSGDAGALARAVLAALDEMKDAERWNHRREACRGRIAEHYSLERMIVSYTRVWGELIHGK
jgi:glycosyltransferase involved in cell wall biosynthesis